MTRIGIFFAALALAVIAISATVTEPATDHPPHAEPPVAAAPEVVFTDAQAVDLWVWNEGERRERERLEALAAEEAARVAAARSTPSVRVVAAGAPAECEGLAIPAAIAWRESRCTRGIDTGNGYYGAYQVARFHWASGGICEGLTWLVPAEEDECARRLSQDGTNLRPWGG